MSRSIIKDKIVRIKSDLKKLKEIKEFLKSKK